MTTDLATAPGSRLPIRDPAIPRRPRPHGSHTAFVLEHLDAPALTAVDRAQAMPACRAGTAILPRGSWTPPVDRARFDGWIGLLVVDGLLTRSVTMGALRSQELLGPGDILRPWDDAVTAAANASCEWKVIDRARLALLDPRFAVAAARWPAVTAALVTAAIRRGDAQTVRHTIIQTRRAEDRLLLLFWHLAERWGRVGPDGVIVPLPLTHACLADLVCLRRPSVTAALTRLRDSGVLARDADGVWHLSRRHEDHPSQLRTPHGPQRTTPQAA